MEPLDNKEEIRFEMDGETFVLKGPWVTSRKRKCVEDQIKYLINGTISDLTYPGEIAAYRIGKHLTEEVKQIFQDVHNRVATVPTKHVKN